MELFLSLYYKYLSHINKMQQLLAKNSQILWYNLRYVHFLCDILLDIFRYMKDRISIAQLRFIFILKCDVYTLKLWKIIKFYHIGG